MKKLAYNKTAVALRHEFAASGSGATLCQISISRTDGTALIVDADDAQQYDFDWGSVVLYVAASAGDVSISLDSPPVNPRPGDRFVIESSDAGAAEEVECKYFNSSTDVMYLERPLLNAHSISAVTNPLFFTYEIDTATNIADYALNTELQVLWAVTNSDGSPNSGLSNSELYRIANQTYNAGAIKSRFRDIYPRVYDNCESRWDNIVDEAYRRIKNYLLTKDRDLDTLTNQNLIEPAMLEQIYLLASPRTDEYEYERNDAKEGLDDELARLEQMKTWFDEDQDTVEDQGEVNIEAWNPHGRHM